MAGILFCRRVVSGPKLYRSMKWYESSPSVKTKPWLYLCTVDEWGKKKNPWLEEESTTVEEDRSDNGSSVYVSYMYKYKDVVSHFRTNRDPHFIRVIQRDVGPRADDVRTNSYNEFMRVYFSHDMPAGRIARSFVADMIVNGTIPDLATFSFFIGYYCKYFKYQYILDVVFTQMKGVGVEADDSFYKMLIYGVCVRFGPIVGYQLLKELGSKHRVQMSLSCYDAVVHQFCKRKTKATTTSTSVLIDVFMDMKQEQIYPDGKIYYCLIKGQRNHPNESFLKAADIGKQIFLEGMKIGALSIIVQKRRSGKLDFKKMRQ